MPAQRRGLKRRKVADKVLPQRIRELVPESQVYMDLLAFEQKLDPDHCSKVDGGPGGHQKASDAKTPAAD